MGTFSSQLNDWRVFGLYSQNDDSDEFTDEIQDSIIEIQNSLISNQHKTLVIPPGLEPIATKYLEDSDSWYIDSAASTSGTISTSWYTL